jgi:hypothetical protein
VIVGRNGIIRLERSAPAFFYERIGPAALAPEVVLPHGQVEEHEGGGAVGTQRDGEQQGFYFFEHRRLYP